MASELNPGLNLRQLAVFSLLMKSRNITETARMLRVSQSAVSQSLRALEQHFGFELFARTSGRIIPTVEALALVPDIERLFAHAASVTNRANELRDDRAGSLSIATIPTLTHSLVPKAVAALRRERPNITLQIESCVQPELVQRIKREISDIGLTYSPILEPGVAAEPLFKTRMVCYVHPDHPLANRRKLTSKDLAGKSVAVLSASTPLGLLLREAIEKQKIKDLTLIETNAASTALGLVKEGIAIALTDVMALYINEPNSVKVIPFEPEIPLVLAAVYSRHRPIARILVRFIAHLRSALSEISSDLEKRGLPGTVLR